MIKNNNTPFMRKDISSTLFTISAAAIALLLLASPLVFSNNFLLQPAQAQTVMTFKTPTAAGGGTDTCLRDAVTLTFDAQATLSSSSSSSRLENTSGTFMVTASDDEQKTYSGSLTSGAYRNNSGGGGGGSLGLSGRIDNVSNAPNCPIKGYTITIATQCSTSNNSGTLNPVTISTSYDTFKGVVECSSSQGGGGNTASSSMTGTTTTTQDSDSDGIPDSSDRCANNSNTKCFKEGDTVTTTQQSSSTSIVGNQTR